MHNLDAIVAVVKQLTSANATQDRINTVVDHVVSAYRRQRVTLYTHYITTIYQTTTSPFNVQ